MSDDRNSIAELTFIKTGQRFYPDGRQAEKEIGHQKQNSGRNAEFHPARATENLDCRRTPDGGDRVQAPDIDSGLEDYAAV